MKKKSLVLVLILLLSCFVCLAEDVVSPGKDFYYLDDAEVLSEALKGEIFYSNQRLFESCGAQIVVVTIPSTGGRDIEDYCIELFNKWGIGDSRKNNGFLLLLAIQDDNYYACPGTGLKEEMATAEIQDMLYSCLEPDFAVGGYEAGVKKFYETAFLRIAHIYNSDVTPEEGIHAYNEHTGNQINNLKR